MGVLEDAGKVVDRAMLAADHADIWERLSGWPEDQRPFVFCSVLLDVLDAIPTRTDRIRMLTSLVMGIRQDEVVAADLHDGDSVVS